jgi:hypothetical protein
LNRYKDGGDGVMKLTTVIHNMLANVDTDVPWGGVLKSTLENMLIYSVFLHRQSLRLFAPVLKVFQ